MGKKFFIGLTPKKFKPEMERFKNEIPVKIVTKISAPPTKHMINLDDKGFC